MIARTCLNVCFFLTVESMLYGVNTPHPTFFLTNIYQPSPKCFVLSVTLASTMKTYNPKPILLYVELLKVST